MAPLPCPIAWVTRRDPIKYSLLLLPIYLSLLLLPNLSLLFFILLPLLFIRVRSPDDNAGLWTSLTASSQAMRYSLTKEPEARDLAWYVTHSHFITCSTMYTVALVYLWLQSGRHPLFRRGTLIHIHSRSRILTPAHAPSHRLARRRSAFEGMHLILRATGIRGLISRCVLAPGSETGDGHWHNSTVQGLENYLWKGDASSDEVCGHMMAYPLIQSLVAPAMPPANATVARDSLLDLARYITSNGYRLIDITGAPTTWGHWEPAVCE